jgi:S1-C subfamily serine protease
VRRALLAALLGAVLLMSTLGACDPIVPGARQGGSGGGQPQPTPTLAVPPTARDLEQTIQQAIHVVQPSVVEVRASNGQGQGIGSGEILSSDGYVVTNAHVVHGFPALSVVLSDGRTLPARLVGEAPGDDLAVLKVDATGLRAITFGDSNAVRVGQFVVALGSPLGLEQSATFGIVSALNRTADTRSDGATRVLTGLIQTSAPINPGNSGGALVDLRGQLIGIPTLGAGTSRLGTPAHGIGFAIPANRVRFVTDQLVKHGRLIRTGQGFLGVAGVDVNRDLVAANDLPVDHGVVIVRFTEDASGTSPAKQADLPEGDILIAVSGTSIMGNGDLAGMLLGLEPGTQVQLTVQRGHSQQQVVATLGERPTTLSR